MSLPNLQVFVYGTLKPGYENHNLYCRDRLLESRPAQVKGELYSLSLGYPAMAHGNSWVQGFILTLIEEGSTLQDLDALEDYQPHRNNNLYEREKANVFDSNGKLIEKVWTYYMEIDTIQKHNGIPIPSGNWNEVSEG